MPVDFVNNPMARRFPWEPQFDTNFGYGVRYEDGATTNHLEPLIQAMMAKRQQRQHPMILPLGSVVSPQTRAIQEQQMMEMRKQEALQRALERMQTPDQRIDSFLRDASEGRVNPYFMPTRPTGGDALFRSMMKQQGPLY